MRVCALLFQAVRHRRHVVFQDEEREPDGRKKASFFFHLRRAEVPSGYGGARVVLRRT